MQLRVEWSHHGRTWGVLGGARDPHESAVQAALREAGEEATVDPAQVRVEAAYVDDHGGWSYTTVIASALEDMDPGPRGTESDAVRWVRHSEVDTLPLHPGFAASWPLLRDVGPAAVLVVDAANTIGSRPDGWWRDRAGAVGRLRDQLENLAGAGIGSGALAVGADAPVPLQRFPVVVLVSEGAARNVPGVPGVEVVPALGSGDDTVVTEVQRRVGLRRVLVVTADRELSSRVQALGAHVVGPRTLLNLL